MDEPTGSTKIAARFLDDALAASVRSEAQDERPSPAASNPTLSANSYEDNASMGHPVGYLMPLA